MNTHVCQFGFRKEKSREALESCGKENHDRGDAGSEANMGSERRRKCWDSERAAVYEYMTVAKIVQNSDVPVAQQPFFSKTKETKRKIPVPTMKEETKWDLLSMLSCSFLPGGKHRMPHGNSKDSEYGVIWIREMEEKGKDSKNPGKWKIKIEGLKGEEGIEWIKRDLCYLTARIIWLSEGVVEENVFPEIPLSETGYLNNSA